MKVLFVDDEVDLLEIASGFFEDENISLDVCSDFHKALKLTEINQYDVIITDANMPSGSGLELLRILKNEKKFPGKLILVTGDLLKNNSKITYHDVIVHKPIAFTDLIEQIKSFNLLTPG